MKSSIIWVAFVVATLQSASLSGSSSLPHNRLAKGEDLIPFESVARDDSLNAELATREGLNAPSLVVARNRTEAVCLIRLLNLRQVAVDQINRVDFNREWLVAVVRGIMGHGGYGISVEKINRTPEGINISVKLIDPDPRVFQQQNMPHPFHLIRVPREKVNSAPQDTWIVRAIKGKLLTQTSRVPTCPPSNNALQPTPR
jgi:hypothetical protein